VKISQKFENACRVLIQLADRHDGETVTRLETLAQREDVSSSFLVQILNDLRRAGLVESKRGKQGGYLLANDPAEMSLYDIAAAMEPGLIEKSVSDGGDSGGALKIAWETTSDLFNDHLKTVSLASLKKDDGGMFYI